MTQRDKYNQYIIRHLNLITIMLYISTAYDLKKTSTKECGIMNSIQFNDMKAIYKHLQKLNMLNSEYTVDQMITLLSPVASLLFVIQQFESRLKTPIQHIHVISEDKLSSFNGSEGFNLLNALSGKKELKLKIQHEEGNENVLSSILSSSKPIKTFETVNEIDNKNDFIYWPQPDFTKTSFNLEIAVDKGRVITSHGSDIERAYASMILSFSGMEIKKIEELADNKNKFSVRTDSHSWGCVFGEVKKGNTLKIPNQTKILKDVIPLLFDNHIELSMQCGATIFTFGKLRYELISILGGYAVNINDRAIFKHQESSKINTYVKVGNISEHHADMITKSLHNKEQFLINAIDMLLSFGIAFCSSEKQQQVLEEKLLTSAKKGQESAALAMAAFYERQNKQNQAYEIIRIHKNNPYCMYNCAYINIHKKGNITEGIAQLILASNCGFLAADTALLEISENDDYTRAHIEQQGISLKKLTAKAVEKNEPETLKKQARKEAEKGGLEKAEEFLFPAAKQGDKEAIMLIIDLYRSVQKQNSLTRKMKGRKNIFELFLKN
jgi:hypothetical protein